MLLILEAVIPGECCLISIDLCRWKRKAASRSKIVQRYWVWVECFFKGALPMKVVGWRLGGKWKRCRPPIP
jgi:hypothetical protein